MVVAVAQNAQQVRRNAGRVDERGAAPVLEEEDVTVARMRILRMSPDVGARYRGRLPAPGRAIGELPAVQAQDRRDGARLLVVGGAFIFEPMRDRVLSNSGGIGEPRLARAGSLKRLAQNIAERVLQRQLLIDHSRCFDAAPATLCNREAVARVERCGDGTRDRYRL